MTPGAGWVGSSTTLTILSSSFPIDGDYTLLWSNSATFDEGGTIILEQGTVPWGSSTFETTLDIPETTYGANYIQFNRFGRDEPLNMLYMVKPHISVYPTSARAGGTVAITGTGFPAGDSGIIIFDGDSLNVSVATSSVGSFKVNITVPQVSLGEHEIIVDTPLLNAETVRTAMVVADTDSPPPPPPDPDPDTDTQTPPSQNGTDPSTSVIIPPDEPLSCPEAIRPGHQTFGWTGSQPVTFYWNEAPDSEDVTYMLEVDNTFNFTTVEPSNRKTGLSGNKYTMELVEGEYYWRVKAVAADGSESPWDTSAYSFRVGVVSRDTLMIAGIAVCMVLIIILLIRAVSVGRRPRDSYQGWHGRQGYR